MSQVKRIYSHDTKAITAGSVVNFNLSVFDTIDDIQLEFTDNGAPSSLANVLASVTRVEATIDGQNWISAPIALLAKLYSFMGNKTYTGIAQVNVFGLNLARLMFDKQEDRDFFAIGTANVETIQIRVYGGLVVNGVTDVTLKSVRRSIVSPLSSYIQVIDYPQQMNAAGISSIETLPKDSTDSYMAVLADAGVNGVIASGECVLNGNSIIQNTSRNVMNANAQFRGFAPVDNIFPYVFVDGAARSVLPMSGITELRFKTTFTAAPTNGQYDLLAISVKNTPQAVIDAVAAV